MLDQDWANFFPIWIGILPLIFNVSVWGSSKVVFSNRLMIGNWWSWLDTLTHNRINFMVGRRRDALNVCTWLIWYLLHRRKILCWFILLNYSVILGWRISFKEINNLLYDFFISDFMMLLLYVFYLFGCLIVFKDCFSVSVFHHLIVLRCYE